MQTNETVITVRMLVTLLPIVTKAFLLPRCDKHPLRDLFLSNTYKPDVDPGHPVGHQGFIAEAFAELMRKAWQVRTLLDHFMGHSSVCEHVEPH